jgi:hypothetical protein
MWVEGGRSVSYDEPIWVDEGAQEKDARKKMDFANDLEGIMLAFTPALSKN